MSTRIDRLRGPKLRLRPVRYGSPGTPVARSCGPASCTHPRFVRPYVIDRSSVIVADLGYRIPGISPIFRMTHSSRANWSSASRSICRPNHGSRGQLWMLLRDKKMPPRAGFGGGTLEDSNVLYVPSSIGLPVSGAGWRAGGVGPSSTAADRREIHDRKPAFKHATQPVRPRRFGSWDVLG